MSRKNVFTEKVILARREKFSCEILKTSIVEKRPLKAINHKRDFPHPK